MKKAANWKDRIQKKFSKVKSPGNDAMRGKWAVPDSEIATTSKIKSLLRMIDENRPRHPIEFDDDHSYGRAGEIYCSPDGHITLLCESREDVCYYQGGLTFLIRKDGFKKLLASHCAAGSASFPPSFNLQRLSKIEVEFILGILSAFDPMLGWTLLGNDLQEFVARKKRELNRWTTKIGALLLTQMLLKTYTSRLYRKLSTILADGIWSEVSDAVPTDDAHVARLTGYLVGSYKSEELMERVMNARCSIYFYSLQALGAMVDIDTINHGDSIETKGQMDRIRLSFQRMGTHVTTSDIRAYMKEAHLYPGEIRTAVQILWSAFDQE
jgi:hypothetical protein